MTGVERRVIISESPVRFDFAGGPTDVEPFKSKEGGYVVNAGIKQRAKVRIIEREKQGIIIKSDDFHKEERFISVEDMNLDGPLRLVKAAVKYIHPIKGLEIHTKVDVPPGSGLGSSAALAIALLGALKRSKGEPNLDVNTLVQDALYVENVMLRNINGGQDQYASALGGFHSFVFEKDDVTVKSIEVSQDTIKELEQRSVLCYCGESHLSGQILDQIMEKYSMGDLITVQALQTMKKISQEIELALIEGDLNIFGQLIKLAGQKQKNYHSAVTPPIVDNLFSVALKNGAVGGKMAGAGGGGCLYFFCEFGRRQDVVDVLEKNNVKIMPMQFSKNGVSVWCN